MSEALQRELLLDLMVGHPQPWSIERDWTTEILDANGNTVVKLQTVAAGEEFIRLASDVSASLEEFEH